MKKILAILFVVFCATVYNSSAQDDCGLPDGCSWNGPSTVELYGCLTVEYYYVICNNGLAYFKLGDITATPPCVPYGPQQVINDAGEAILQEPWLDQIRAGLFQVNDCYDNISQYSRECYYWGGPYPSEPDQLIPCHGESCCEGYWKICLTGVNPKTYSYTKTGSARRRPCPRPLETGCFTVCD